VMSTIQLNMHFLPFMIDHWVGGSNAIHITSTSLLTLNPTELARTLQSFRRTMAQ
jgi:hypothetical protein